MAKVLAFLCGVILVFLFFMTASEGFRGLVIERWIDLGVGYLLAGLGLIALSYKGDPQGPPSPIPQGNTS